MESSIKSKALELGFAACGIAKAEAVDDDTRAAYERWIAENRHGEMDYLARNMELRFDPTLLVPGCRSIIVTAMNYYPADHIPDDEWQIAYYAYGRDYHHVVKERLFQLLAYMDGLRREQGELPPYGEQRVFVDSAPVLERYWAVRAGLGWEGRNHLLIIPGMGSWFFLGLILTDLPLRPDIPLSSRCGTCHRCVDACPTGALTLRADGTTCLDARGCVSYLTIEQNVFVKPNEQSDACISSVMARKRRMKSKSPIPSGFSSRVGGRIYGCDSCQKACPWNRFATPTAEPAFRPSSALLGMRRHDWQALTPEAYSSLFSGSAVKRAKYDGLRRNIDAAAQNESLLV